MKPFVFKEFSVAQSGDVFRVGTDAVLLGALAETKGKSKVLEVGCGTGIISLMIAQRNTSAQVLAIDISQKAVDLTHENFLNSPYSDRLEALKADFSVFTFHQKFDLIISNPPYFELNSSQKDVLARQMLTLDFQSLIDGAAANLSAEGVFSVIIPALESERFTAIAVESRLSLVRKVKIIGLKGKEVKRVILEFGFKAPDQVMEKQLVVQETPRVFTQEYLGITKDFHVFKSSR